MKIDGDAGDGKFRLERALPVLLIIAIIVISTMIFYRLLSGTNESNSNNVAKIHSPVSETEQSIEIAPQVVREDKLEQHDSNENTEVSTEIETKNESNDQKTEIISRQEETEEAQRTAKQEEAEEAKRIARQEEEAEEAKRIARQEEVEEAKRIAKQEEVERIARQEEAEKAKRIADQRDLEPKQQLVLKEAAQPEKKERLDSEWVSKNWEKAREVEVVALLSEAESQLIVKDLSVSILKAAMGKYRSLERITGGDPRVSKLYKKILDSHVTLAVQQEQAEQLSDAMTTIDNGLALNNQHPKLLTIKKKISKKLTKLENLGQSAPLIGTF